MREAPEPHLSRSKSLTMSSVSSLKRYPSAPDSLSQSLSSSLSDIVSCSLNSQVAIREEDAARDTQTDVTDGRVVECDERVLGQEFESAPSSVCSSVCDQSHLDEETVESMKEESVLGYDVMEETDRKRVEETGEHVDGTLLDMREEEKQGIEEDGQGIEEEKEGIEEERTCNGDEDMKSSDVDSALQVRLEVVRRLEGEDNCMRMAVVDKQTDRHTNRQIHRQTDRQTTDRQIHRLTHRQTHTDNRQTDTHRQTDRQTDT